MTFSGHNEAGLNMQYCTYPKLVACVAIQINAIIAGAGETTEV